MDLTIEPYGTSHHSVAAGIDRCESWSSVDWSNRWTRN